MNHCTGVIFIGIRGLSLSEEEQIWLRHPLVMGVILFSRNYASKLQLIALCRSIRQVRPELIISVDHEGGRVQRFCAEFTRIPDMRSLGRLYDQNASEALSEAEHIGRLLTTELKEVGVDLSYTPVCDIDYDHNQAIGNRAFHCHPETVCQLVSAFYRGVRSAGGAGVAKHFPGHGYVKEDTHQQKTIDPRTLDELLTHDLLPFIQLIHDGIEAIMPAHIVYPCLDAEHTAVSSRIWLNFLREQLGFKGLIISDDLDMGGADHLGDPVTKIKACFRAGIDIVLCCNDFDAIGVILESHAIHAISYNKCMLSRYNILKNV